MVVITDLGGEESLATHHACDKDMDIMSHISVHAIVCAIISNLMQVHQTLIS